MSSASGPARGRLAGVATLGALLALFALRGCDAARRHSLTSDEIHYLAAGLYLWRTGDYDYRRSLLFHPPLAYHLGSLPLLGLDLPPLPPTRDLADALLGADEPGPTRVRVATRLAYVALATWGALLAFAWTRELAGGRAGLVAAFLYSFAPALLAHAWIAHSDITVCVFYLQTLYAGWRFVRQPGGLRFALLGISLGLALASKASALLLLPALGLLLLEARWRRAAPAPGVALRRAALAAAAAGAEFAGLLVIATGVLWLGYGGSFAMAPVESGAFAGVRLPGYLLSLFVEVAANAQSRPIYFAGEIYTDGGRWYFLPVAFLLKTPLPLLLLLLAALALRRRPSAAASRDLLLWLGLPAAVYLAAACFWLRVPLGVRYLLPLVPLLCVFVAARLARVAGAGARGALALLAAWLAVDGFWIHPHYLAYFNALAGGPARADRWLVESNLDWGQDLPALARDLEQRGGPQIHLGYFGPEPAARYGIHSQTLVGCAPVTGLVAISQNVLHGLYSPGNPFRRPPADCYDWLRAREPVARPGYSILVYELPAATGTPRAAAAE